MGVLTLGTSSSVSFDAPSIVHGGNGKSYSSTFTSANGSFARFYPGTDTYGVPGYFMLIASDNVSTEMIVRQSASDGHTQYGDTQYWGGSSGYGLLTSSGDGGRIYDIACNQNVTNSYFGGVTPTVSQVYDKVVSRYGNHQGFAIYTQWGGYPCVVKPGDDPNGIASCTVSGVGVDSNLYGQYDFTMTTGGTIFTPSSATSDEMFWAYILFGDPVIPTKLRFDVYINGRTEPAIDVRWSAVSRANDFSLQTTNALTSSYPVPIQDIPAMRPIKIDPNLQRYVMAETRFINNYNYGWSGSFSSQYLTECNKVTDSMPSSVVVDDYGVGVVNNLQLYLQFTHQANVLDQGIMTRGQMFRVNIPHANIENLSDITVEEVTNTAYENQFETEVVIHLSAPPNDIDDDPPEYPTGEDIDGDKPGPYPVPIPDFTPYIPTGFPGKSLLTKTYSMIDSVLQNLGTKLWTQSYFNVLKIQSNPIENVIAVKWFPFSISGTSEEIKIGDVLMGVNGEKIDNIYQFSTTPFRIESYYGTFLDCSPYTTIKLHLPYVGIVQLDAAEVWHRTLTIKYVVDLVTGDCVAFIIFDGVPFMNVSGKMGVDIPLTSSNRVQSEIRAAGQTISSVIGASAHLMGGDPIGAAGTAATGFLNIAGMDYTTQRASTHSPACVSYENRAIYIEYSHPATEVDTEGFKSLHGYPCHKFTTMNALGSGFVKADMRTKINIAMTSEENRMLEELMTQGVYI